MAGTITVGTISDGSNSGSATDAIKGSARAWVNFKGTGTVSIRASYNVSSITDINQGRYQINFTTAFSDTNYVCAAASSDSNEDDEAYSNAGTGWGHVNTSNCRVYGYNGGWYDMEVSSAVFFR